MTEFVWALFSGIKTKVKYRILRAFFLRVGIFATHQTSGNKYGCETISLGLEKKNSCSISFVLSAPRPITEYRNFNFQLMRVIGLLEAVVFY